MLILNDDDALVEARARVIDPDAFEPFPTLDGHAADVAIIYQRDRDVRKRQAMRIARATLEADRARQVDEAVLVERIARALWEQEKIEGSWEAWIDDARAVMAAMKGEG